MSIEVVSIKSIGKRPVCDLTIDKVNHYFTDHGLVSHNTGVIYSANEIFVIGRQQDKGDDGIQGFTFVINVEKSRRVREKSKILINVNFDKGINKYSGLLEIALASGHVVKPKNGWYAKVNQETGEILDKNYREKDTHNKEFWTSVLEDPTFEAWINKNYGIAEGQMIMEDTDIDKQMDNVETDEE